MLTSSVSAMRLHISSTPRAHRLAVMVSMAGAEITLPLQPDAPLSVTVTSKSGVTTRTKPRLASGVWV